MEPDLGGLTEAAMDPHSWVASWSIHWGCHFRWTCAFGLSEGLGCNSWEVEMFMDVAVGLEVEDRRKRHRIATMLRGVR